MTIECRYSKPFLDANPRYYTDDPNPDNWAEAFTATAAANDGLIRLDDCQDYPLLNWEPAEDTVLIAQGATIYRPSDEKYPGTNISACVVNTQKCVEIWGGQWSAGPDAAFNQEYTGTICQLPSGSLTIWGGIHENCWSGLFGGEAITEDKACYLRVFGTKYQDCWRNVYVSDIEDFLMHGVISQRSARDGIRTFRNICRQTFDQMIVIDNGNGDFNNSQDGFDLFSAAIYTSIMNSMVGRNFSAGFDIKNADQDFNILSREVRSIKIAYNHVFENGNQGIKIDNNPTAALTIDNIDVSNNTVEKNRSYGIWFSGPHDSSIAENMVNENWLTGIYLDDGSHKVTVTENRGDRNGTHPTSNATHAFIHVNEDCDHVYVYENSTDKDPAETIGNQTYGIWHEASGVCRDNCVEGYTYGVFATKQDGTLKGKNIEASILPGQFIEGGALVKQPIHTSCVNGMLLTASFTSSTNTASTRLCIENKRPTGTQTPVDQNSALTGCVPLDLAVSAAALDRLVDDGFTLAASGGDASSVGIMKVHLNIAC